MALIRPFLIIAALLPAPAYGAAQVEDIGAFPGLGARSNAISGDGSTILATKSSNTRIRHAARWTDDGGMEYLQPQGPLLQSVGVGLSDDGRYAIGFVGDPALTTRAVRWSPTGSIEYMTPERSIAEAISADGQTVIGQSPGVGSWIWSSTNGLTRFMNPSGTPNASVVAVNTDGSVVVGNHPVPSGFRVIRWTAATGSIHISSANGPAAVALHVSDDGAVVVGRIGDTVQEREPFRWTASTGLVPLGQFVPGVNHSVTAMSSDGSLLFGTAGDEEYVWSKAAGYSALSASENFVPTACTPDGSVIVGGQFTGTAANSRPVRWTATDGLVALTSIGGVSGIAVGVSDDGSRVTGWGEAADGTSRAVLWRVDGTIGTTYCGPAVANSSGGAAEISLTGSNIRANGELTLTARSAPANAAGYFLASRLQGFVQMPAGSQGNLCLGGSIGRYVGPGQVQISNGAGSFSLTVNPSAMPTPLGPVQPSIGESWNFQGWFRDANPTPTSNFTNGARLQIY